MNLFAEILQFFLHPPAPEAMARTLTMILPTIPVGGAILLIAFYYVGKKDLSRILLPLTMGILATAQLMLILLILRHSLTVTIALSELPYSIHFFMDHTKAYFLMTLLIPLCLSIFHLSQLPTLYARVIFLFYLTGCTGIVVSGDIFNFFVFFELMIMAAYVLIALNKDYYASIKYMFFGSLGATFLLAAVIVWFRSGYYFTYTELPAFTTAHPEHSLFLLMLLSMVFLIKGGIFPVSSWPGPCHGAAPTLVSSFLSSFSTFTSVYGFYYFVLIPAEAAGLSTIPEALQIFAALTIFLVSLFAFFEDRFRYMIAAATPVTVSTVLILCISGAVQAAFFYMVLHSAYKSVLFIVSHQCIDPTLPQSDDTGENPNEAIVLSPPLFGVLIGGGLLTAALFPAATAYLKEPAIKDNPLITAIFLIASYLLLGGFSKFSYRICWKQARWSQILLTLLFFSALIAAYGILTPHFSPMPLSKIGVHSLVLVSALYTGKRLFTILPAAHRFASTRLYRTLNHELLSVLVLFLLFNLSIQLL
ncbi:proton-conducting transporter membrane subunit [Chitinivibrio alkaliphilus]|uniref:Putative monovalent cation/H+ antiporter subunit D n=1 Tax=Chitinivibrio alkaliphilus ACht1 TaxID=1313304 RepID=U7D356_9BACT|nr:proton-conducting transporter membrane subunit [Chitinivibrio alkaliphilus]ERP30934.1 putative monovalent cation/H+ antiporter subunit D [Chitinivibrio alkaliphilus ACht1]